MKPNEGQVPSQSRPLRGKICIRCSQGPDFLESVNQLASLDPEYDGLVIEARSRAKEEIIEILLQLSATTMKYLKGWSPQSAVGIFNTLRRRNSLSNTPHPRNGRYDYRSLPHNSQELELRVDWPRWKHIAILSFMTSTELRKITFLAFSVPGRDIILQERDVQDSVDEQPCEPVTRV